MSLTVRTITPPVDTVVTLAQARSHLRLDNDYDDALVMTYVAIASEYVEKIVNRALLVKTIEATFVSDPVAASTVPVVYGPAPILPQWANNISSTYGTRFDLPYAAPVGEVLSVIVEPTDGSDPITLDPAKGDYRVLTRTDPACVIVNTTWTPAFPLTVRYTCGYPTGTTPQTLVSAVLLMVAHLYEHRGEASHEMPAVIDRLIAPLRVASFGSSFIR